MSKRNDTDNYLGGWPKWFQEQENAQKVMINDKWAELRTQEKLVTTAAAAVAAETTEQFNIRAAMDEYHTRMMRSRENICYLYLTYYQYSNRERADVNAGDVRELEFRATRLAEAKAKHLAEFGEELTLSFRKVV